MVSLSCTWSHIATRKFHKNEKITKNYWLQSLNNFSGTVYHLLVKKPEQEKVIIPENRIFWKFSIMWVL